VHPWLEDPQVGFPRKIYINIYNGGSGEDQVAESSRPLV
jgi:hypothetical protein